MAEECLHPFWRRSAPGWKQEEEGTEWSQQRSWQIEQCPLCQGTRFSHPLAVRRRYRLTMQETDQSSLIKKLHAQKWSDLSTLITRMNRNRFEVQELLNRWVEDGSIEVEERWVTSDWQIERARLSPCLTQQQAHLELISQERQDRQAKEALVRVLYQWQKDYQLALQNHAAERDLMALLTQLGSVFEQQEAALQLGQLVPIAGTSKIAGGMPHQRWIALLRGVLELLAHPRFEHERIFSARWLQDSKALHKERGALEAFLDIEGGLARIGLVKHTPVVLSWGGWRATALGYTFDGRAALSFTATPADIIVQFEAMQLDAHRLLIVENRTPFELLVQPHKRDAQTLYLDGAGFPGHAERTLVAHWLRANPQLTWYVWTDFDLGGVRIQQHWQEWAMQEKFSVPSAYRWTCQDLDMCQSIGIPLTEERRFKLLQLSHPLALLLCEWGYTAEQEAILGIFQDW